MTRRLIFPFLIPLRLTLQSPKLYETWGYFQGETGCPLFISLEKYLTIFTARSPP